MPKLSKKKANKIEGLSTYKEIRNSLQQTKSAKSPGISGFTAEFFKTFWKQLGHFVHRSLNLGFRKGELNNPTPRTHNLHTERRQC